MAESAAVLAGIRRAPGVRYAALTPNMRGLEGALAARADEVAVFGSASDGFSRANINATVAESLERFAPVIAAAREAGVPVRGYVSCVVDCPYDGAVAPDRAAWLAGRLYRMGCYEISLGDTLGHGRPDAVDAMLSAVLDEVPAAALAGHFHDTAGRALANIEVSLARGVRVFDAAIAGLGGCPFAPGAAGNVATEAVHDRLAALGYGTGLDRDVLARAGEMARGLRG
jgi:hydroxymethylglutaryl-CoA lyase